MFDFNDQVGTTMSLNQTQVNAEVKQTFQAVHDWVIPVTIGLAALLFLSGFLSFMLWKGGD